jgi:uncharacterized membrane protein
LLIREQIVANFMCERKKFPSIFTDVPVKYDCSSRNTGYSQESALKIVSVHLLDR